MPAHLPCPAGYDRLRPYVAFHAALRSAFQAFVAGLEARCRGILAHHLETATSEYALGLLAGGCPWAVDGLEVRQVGEK